MLSHKDRYYQGGRVMSSPVCEQRIEVREPFHEALASQISGGSLIRAVYLIKLVVRVYFLRKDHYDVLIKAVAERWESLKDAERKYHFGIDFDPVESLRKNQEEFKTKAGEEEALVRATEGERFQDFLCYLTEMFGGLDKGTDTVHEGQAVTVEEVLELLHGTIKENVDPELWPASVE